MAMAAQDAYERQRVNVAVAWAVAASLCVAFAVFGFDGVVRGRAASTDSAVFQGLVSGLIGVDASAKDAVTVSAVIAGTSRYAVRPGARWGGGVGSVCDGLCRVSRGPLPCGACGLAVRPGSGDTAQ